MQTPTHTQPLVTENHLRPLRRVIHELLSRAESDPERREEYRHRAAGVALAITCLRGISLSDEYGDGMVSP